MPNADSVCYPASALAVAHHFADIPLAEKIEGNWGCGDTKKWSVNDETYINGCLVTVDLDYIMGYLLECVDRTSGTVSYVVVVIYHGKHPIKGWHLDCAQYEPACGTFSNRTDAADPSIVAHWATDWVFGTVEAHQEAQERRGRLTDQDR